MTCMLCSGAWAPGPWAGGGQGVVMGQDWLQAFLLQNSHGGCAAGNLSGERHPLLCRYHCAPLLSVFLPRMVAPILQGVIVAPWCRCAAGCAGEAAAAASRHGCAAKAGAARSGGAPGLRAARVGARLCWPRAAVAAAARLHRPRWHHRPARSGMHVSQYFYG